MSRAIPRASHPAARAVLIFLGLSLVLCGNLAAQCISNAPAPAGGDWDDPLTWTSCPTFSGYPGPGDTALIVANDLVKVASQTAQADALDVLTDGELRFTGFGHQLEIQNLTIHPDGRVGSDPNVNVYVTSPPGLPYFVLNEGDVQAGTGGDVFFHDGSPGGDLPCPLGSTIQSQGGATFFGGAPDGNVYLLADTIALDDTTVLGGGGNPPFDFLCQSVAGSVYIAGVTVSLTGNTVVEQGINGTGATPPPSCGGSFTYRDGSVRIVGQNCNTGTGSVTVDNSTVGSPLGNQCAIIFAATTVFNSATINSGTGTGCIYWDPPDLYLSGDSELAAADILVAGENLDASGLASRTLPTPALRANDTLEIRLKAGGFLDLTGLTPGFPYFAAGSSITICADADQIATDPGVDLADLMEPAPTLEAPKSTFVVTLNPGSQHRVTAGSSVDQPVQATSLSTDSAPVTLYVEDSKGWLAGGAVLVSASLAPGDAILRNLTIDVPATAGPGDATILKASAEIAGRAPEVSYWVFEVSREEEPCKGRGCDRKGGGKGR